MGARRGERARALLRRLRWGNLARLAAGLAAGVALIGALWPAGPGPGGAATGLLLV